MSSNAETEFRVSPGGSLRGRLRVPGDKSISHRALILGALATGGTRISGLLGAADVLATRTAMSALGVPISDHGDEVLVEGVGIDGLSAADGDLDLGNSGTGMRLLAGLLCGQRFGSRLVGDASLSARPMARIIEPLTLMGARISGREGKPPLSIEPAPALRGIEYRTPVASAQVKSCLLLAGLCAEGVTRVHEPQPSRDHTERMLEAFGCPVERGRGSCAVRGGSRLKAARVAVPGDFSSAAFFLVAGSIVPGSDLVLERVGLNPLRCGLLGLLEEMGARIERRDRPPLGGEPVADLRVRHAPLKGIEVESQGVASAIDEFPILFVAAALAEGETRISGAAELRVKESDRIAVMCRGLGRLGADVEERPDGAVIRGGDRLGGAVVDAAGDHRCAMSLALAGLMGDGVTVVKGAANVATSYPRFARDARDLGAEIEAVAGS